MFDQKAEKLNGRLAMIGVIAGLISYTITGHILPGVFKMTTPKPIEKEKQIAETINGRFAMIGLVAAIGAYLTTGQIIPGFV